VQNPRQLAFLALRDVWKKGAYTDIALGRVLVNSSLASVDRGLVCELVYGIVRRRRSLDALIDQLGTKKAEQQPPDLRIILHLGLYQLRYLDQIPPSAAVNTTVELTKENKLKPLAGVVNGLLRAYLRRAEKGDPLQLPVTAVQRLGVLHSFPDWIVEIFIQQFGAEETDRLLAWFNQSPTVDLRVNILKTTLEQLESTLTDAGVTVSRIPHLPQALRLTGNRGNIEKLPGFAEGWWTVQDGSAQLTSHLLEPQRGETVIDACAAPGGKTTHIAELMGDEGKIWGCDRLRRAKGDRMAKRLEKVRENARRLQLQSINLCAGDSRDFPQFKAVADRVLLDAPCSGLGTLHKRPDIRWRQTPDNISHLPQLQRELLAEAATWVKLGGALVYSTCTLNSSENEEVIQGFLETHPQWQIRHPSPNSPAYPFAHSSGWIKVLPHQHLMDGFFMVKLLRGA
jgi:16S rRNA (cytosine967-C5)-methyltransferase